MSREDLPSSPIPKNDTLEHENDAATSQNNASSPQNGDAHASSAPTTPSTYRSNRPSRACTIRAAARMQQQTLVERKRKPKKDEQQQRCDESPQQKEQCSGGVGVGSKTVTPLVGPPEPAQLPRWSLRSMWELASVLNFLHVFRGLLNIQVEFSAEEFETALITPNDTLGDIHMPLLKAIPPITRMALTRDTWITVLCRKLRDWWHWVAEGELPLVASHGLEVEAYKTLDPGVRVVILKAICDIRVEQEDIRNYIDNSLKHGVQLPVFRKERFGGDSQGIHYWYEDDPVIGHRLYREIRKVEVKKAKVKGSQVIPTTTYLWEAVATNFEEFQDVCEKLFTSKNRTEASLGKKLKNDMLPEIERIQRRKEKLLKKQHRQALLLDNFVNVDGLGPGRSLRDRKRVTYTFDDYDRSINEAIKITKRKHSPEPFLRRDGLARAEASANGKLSGPPHGSENDTFSAISPDLPDYDDNDEENKLEQLDRSNRRRQRPQRYSAKEFVEAVSDNEADFDSDDDIVGEAVYDDDYLKKRKQRKLSSSSEGEADEEYRGDEENGEDEEDEEEEDTFISSSEVSDEPPKFKKLSGRTRRETKLRSVDELQSGLRRSKRATRNRINYRQYEMSESDAESMKPEKSNASEEEHSDTSENAEYSAGSQESDGNDDGEDIKVYQPVEGYNDTVEKDKNELPEKPSSPVQNEVDGVRKRRFLDLNELAPGSGFDDGPNTIMKDED